MNSLFLCIFIILSVLDSRNYCFATLLSLQWLLDIFPFFLTNSITGKNEFFILMYIYYICTPVPVLDLRDDFIATLLWLNHYNSSLFLHSAQAFGKETPKNHEVVLFWGQNTARLPEKSLDYFCGLGKYNTIVISYITEFFASKTSKYQ